MKAECEMDMAADPGISRDEIDDGTQSATLDALLFGEERQEYSTGEIDQVN
jgi:hypothetical protein